MMLFYHVKIYTGIIVDGMIWHSPTPEASVLAKAAISCSLVGSCHVTYGALAAF